MENVVREAAREGVGKTSSKAAGRLSKLPQYRRGATNVEYHSSGTSIHWSEREYKDPKHYKVKIICHVCNLSSFIRSETVRRPRWLGLCSTCALERRNPNNLGHDLTLSSGSIIHWSRLEGEHVPVTCGICLNERSAKKESIQSNYTSKKRTKGFCPHCRHKKYFNDEKLSTKSTIHWWERSGKRIPVTCGRCGIKRLVFDGKCGEDKFTGFCHDCGVGKRTKDELHPSGATIHWGDRHIGKKQRVAFSCANCGERDFTWAVEIRYRDWHGLCSKHAPDRRREKKYDQDEMLPSGATIHFGSPDPGNPRNVPISCVCGATRSIPRAVALLLRG